MPTIVTLATIAAAGSLALLAYLILPMRPARAPAAVRARLAAGSPDSPGRGAGGLSGGLVGLARMLTPPALVAGLERRLVLAGRPWPLERVLVAKVALGAAAGAYGGSLFLSAPSVGRAAIVLVGAGLAYFTPELLLYSRAQERQKAIESGLADALDQMTIAVEAGLGFESAMARVGKNGKGPLAEEFVRTLHYLHAGVSRARAFRDLADRTEVRDLRRFVVALLQADAYGVPMAEVLRTQSAEMRLKRRQRAEESAMKIPIKVLFPLLFCIFPTLFIVLLGPAGINIYSQLMGG